MNPPVLTDAVRAQLLDELRSISSDSEADRQEGRTLRVFTPLPVHQDVFLDRVMVVRGDRGTGKTELFDAIRQAMTSGAPLERLLGVQVNPSASWIDGFSADSSVHPFTDVLAELAADGQPDAIVRGFWLGHLAGCLPEDLKREMPEPFRSNWTTASADPKKWIDTARVQSATIVRALEWLDGELGAKGRKVVVMYDHLDLLRLERESRRFVYARVLVELWFNLSLRLRNIRPKIFLRSDLHRALRSAWPDASKIEARTVELRWRQQDLFRLMARHLGAREGLRAWMVGHGVRGKTEDDRIGWVPEDSFVDERSRAVLMGTLAAEFMGTGSNKGKARNWIVTKTADALGVVHPRSVLRVLKGAADQARSNDRRTGPLLSVPELMQGLEEASNGRASELAEEYKVVRRLHVLRGQTMLMAKDELERRLGAAPTPEDEHGGDGAAALKQLVEIGVLVEVPEKDVEIPRYDVQEIYRLGFGIRRRGGPNRVGNAPSA